MIIPGSGQLRRLFLEVWAASVAGFLVALLLGLFGDLASKSGENYSRVREELRGAVSDG